jgi:hypothetical protein
MRLADQTHQVTTLRNLAVLFQRAGRAEATAELLGSLEAAAVPTYGEEAERLAEARRWVQDELTPDALEGCLAAGAGRDLVSTAAWALAEIERQLA